MPACVGQEHRFTGHRCVGRTGESATLKVYEGAPHGLMGAFREQFEADLLAFLAD